MFIGAGANYYATAWNGAEIVYDFLNGAKDFSDANNQNWEKITVRTLYHGVEVWKNFNGNATFVGDWSGKFPKANETTPYNDQAAESWYNSDRSTRNALTSSFSVNTEPIYTREAITFKEESLAIGSQITSYLWDFGDVESGESITQQNQIHTYKNPGNYIIKHKITDKNTKTSENSKNITVKDKKYVWSP